MRTIDAKKCGNKANSTLFMLKGIRNKIAEAIFHNMEINNQMSYKMKLNFSLKSTSLKKQILKIVSPRLKKEYSLEVVLSENLRISRIFKW